MLSVKECRKLLGRAGAKSSDVEIERLRDQLCGLADVAIGQRSRRNRQGGNPRKRVLRIIPVGQERPS